MKNKDTKTKALGEATYNWNHYNPFLMDKMFCCQRLLHVIAETCTNNLRRIVLKFENPRHIPSLAEILNPFQYETICLLRRWRALLNFSESRKVARYKKESLSRMNRERKIQLTLSHFPYVHVTRFRDDFLIYFYLRSPSIPFPQTCCLKFPHVVFG